MFKQRQNMIMIASKIIIEVSADYVHLNTYTTL